MEQLLKKNFEIQILNQTCKYEQFTMQECMEFTYLLKDKNFKLEDWIYDFLKDKIHLRKENLLQLDLTKFMEILFDTAFRGFFKKWMGKAYPYEAYIMFLSEKFNIDPDTLLRRYTPEQLSYYCDWIIYNLNEQTKEWQKRNKINQEMKKVKQDSIDNDLKEIQEMEQILKSKK